MSGRSDRPRGPDEVVTTQDALVAAAERLQRTPRVALDTEAASFHRYVDRVYLVQASTDHETILVDPLAVPDLSPLGGVLADSGIELVFHDADYDLRILDRDYGFRARRVFDTRLAAQLAGEPSVGLGSLLERHFGVRLNKKFQRADWSRRPLPGDMLAYAADDTRYLPALRDRLEQRLRELGRLAWAQEDFGRLEEVRWTGVAPDDGNAYLRIKGARGIRDPRGRAVLRAVYRWRDDLARELDRAPFRVVGNEALLAIARKPPRTADELAAVPGMPRAVLRRHGADILAAVGDARNLPASDLPEVPRGTRPPSDQAYDQRLERLKNLRNARAEAVGLDPGLVCPNNTLQAVARAVPAAPEDIAAIPELRRWQRELLEDAAILRAVHG